MNGEIQDIEGIITRLQNETNDNCRPVQGLAKVICELFGVPEDVLFLRSRKRELVDARRLYFYILDKKANWGPSAVSRHTASISCNKGWDHASVIYASRKCEEIMETEKSYRQKADEIFQALKEDRIRIPKYSQI